MKQQSPEGFLWAFRASAFRTEDYLVRTASRTCGGTLGLVLRLQNHTVERGRSQEAAADHAHPAQWVAGIGPTPPGAAAIGALEDDPALHARGFFFHAEGGIRDGSDVLV